MLNDLGKRLRRMRKRAQQAREKKASRRKPAPALWLRVEGEVSECPACGARDLTPLEVIRARGVRPGKQTIFVTGCRQCGLVFISPMPPQEDVERFYTAEGDWAGRNAERTTYLAGQHARGLVRSQSSGAVARKRVLLFEAMRPHIDVQAPAPGARVLDIGCGDGKLLNALQDLGWETYGIEPSTGVAFLRHHRLETPPPDAIFDFAILHHVLEHVPAPMTLLAQAAAAVREGGMIFVSVPRIDTLPDHGDFRYCINGRTHLIAFTETCLRGLLARAGFETVAALHGSALDDAMSGGVPLRMRLLARRTHRPVPLPAAPLDAAVRALRGYSRAHHSAGRRLAGLIPVRLRAGLAERTRWAASRRS